MEPEAPAGIACDDSGNFADDYDTADYGYWRDRDIKQHAENLVVV